MIGARDDSFAGDPCQFLGPIGKVLPGWFPHLPGQSQYNRRLRRLTPWIAMVQLRLAELVAEDRVLLAQP